MTVSGESPGPLADEVVMITGASRGLGRVLAEEFAAAGAHVSGCARGAGELDRARRSLHRRGLTMHTAEVDVTDEAAVAEWVRDVRRTLGTPTVLINNASILGPRVDLSTHDVERWRRTVDVNLNGSFIAARAVLPMMLEAARGSIIQLSSGAAVPPRTRWGAYAVSKAAVDAMAVNLAAELDGTGVRVNLVDPGAMRTSMRADAYPLEDPDTLEPPSARAAVFLWLASRRSGGVSGQRFRADGWRLP